MISVAVCKNYVAQRDINTAWIPKVFDTKLDPYF